MAVMLWQQFEYYYFNYGDIHIYNNITKIVVGYEKRETTLCKK